MGGAPGAKKALGPLVHLGRRMFGSLFTKQKTKFFIAQFNRPDLATLRDMMEAGDVVPMLEQTYPFEELPYAMAKLGDGHVRGKLSVTVSK